MFRKIITYFLIIAVVLPVLAGAMPLPAGGGVNRAQAADATKGNGGGSIEDPCGAFSATNVVLDTVAAITAPFRYEGSVWDCFSYTIVNILYTFVMNISILIAGYAGDLFNLSIQFSLTGSIFDADKNTMIKDGWTMVRDLLNLIFIFILLFAAISTILQYGNMDIKKILPSLIVVALLVNFSMMITKMVIDASHIFAWEFYNQIDVTDGGKVPNMQNSINVDRDFEKKHLANVFMAGFNPQRLLIAGGVATTTEEEAEKEGKSVWKQVVEKSMKEGETLPSTLWRMAVIILSESALAIFAAFILFAGAIMFIIRVVVLWLVIIFSPIAFLGYILPGMKEYSGMWWKYLIGQSFFAPAFLFMFMLATKFINSNLIDSLLKITSNNDSKIATGLNMGEIILIFFNFLIVGLIMGACLIVAKKLGAETAQYGMKWAHKGKDLALGGALKYVPKPLLRHTVGSISSGMAKSERAERMTANMPIIGGWMKGVLKKGGDVGGFDKIMEQRIKTGQSLSTPELRAQYLSNLSAREQAKWYKNASARTRVELEDAALKGGHTTALNNMMNVHKKLSLEEQEKTIKARAEVDLKKTDDQLADIFLDRSEEIQKEIINQMKDGRKAGFINKLHSRRGTTSNFTNAVASTTSLTGSNIRKFRPDLIDTSTLAGVAALEEAIKKHKPEDILLLDKDIAANPEVMTEMVKNYKGGHVNKIIDRGDELYTKFKDELKSISGGSNSVSVVVRNLQRIGNQSLASLIQSNEIMQKSLGLV